MLCKYFVIPVIVLFIRHLIDKTISYGGRGLNRERKYKNVYLKIRSVYFVDKKHSEPIQFCCCSFLLKMVLYYSELESNFHFYERKWEQQSSFILEI